MAFLNRPTESTPSVISSTEPDRRAHLYIVDPNLRNVVGHYFEYDKAVAEGGEQEGFRPVILANRDVEAELAASVGAHPIFRDDIWGSAAKPRGQIGRAFGRLHDNLRFCVDLVRALLRFGLPRGSVVFAHTFIDRQIIGLALLPLILFWAKSVSFVFLLRYQPDFYNSCIARLSFRLMERLARWRSIHLTTDSARLGDALERMTSLRVHVLPIPHVPPPPPPPPQGEDAPVRRPIQLVSLGNARDEKGIFEILGAIRILHRQGMADDLHFVLQCNDAAPDVQAAITAFRDDNLPGCTLLFDKLSSEHYYRILHEADFVLLPYWRSIYEARTSGVLMEALSAGRPVIATRDTWMSDQLRDHGAGLLCPDRNPEALARIIRAAVADRDNLHRLALERRGPWLQTHNPGSLVRMLTRLGTGMKTAQVPPQRIAVLYPHGDFDGGQGGASRRVNLMTEFLKPYVKDVRVLQSGGQTTLTPTGIRVEALGDEPRCRFARLWTGLVVVGASLGKGLEHRWIFWQFARMSHVVRFRRHLRQIIRWSDVVLLEYPFWARVVVRIAREEGRPVVLTSHDIIADQIVGMPVLRALAWRQELAALRSADRVVAVSIGDQAKLESLGLAPLLASNPSDGRLFEIERLVNARDLVTQFYGVDLPSRRICLFVGSLFEPNVRAVAEIRKIARDLCSPDGEHEVGFVVVGACSPPDRDGNFVALGRVDDGLLLSLYAICDLVIVPIPGGTGSSLKTVEGMAAGKVVLGTAAAFRGLSVQPGQHVVLEDEMTAYPQRIRDALADPEGMIRMGRAARLFAHAYDSRVAYQSYLTALGLTAVDGDATLTPPGLIDTTLLALAREALGAGHTAIAHALAEEVLRVEPDETRAHAILASTGSAEDADGAGATEQEIGVEPADEPCSCMRLGRQALWDALHASRYDELLSRVSDQLRTHSESGELHFLMAQGLHNQKRDLQAAAFHYSQALAAGYDPFWTLLGRARLHRDVGMPHRQCVDLLKAMANGPRRALAHGCVQDLVQATARVLTDSARSARSWRPAPRKMTSSPPPTVLPEVRAALWSMFREGRYDEVVARGTPLLDTVDDGEIHFIIAQSLHNGSRDLDRSLALYDEALRRGYSAYWVRLGRGRLYYDIGLPRRAVDDHARAVLMNPLDPSSRMPVRRILRTLLSGLRR